MLTVFFLTLELIPSIFINFVLCTQRNLKLKVGHYSKIIIWYEWKMLYWGLLLVNMLNCHLWTQKWKMKASSSVDTGLGVLHSHQRPWPCRMKSGIKYTFIIAFQEKLIFSTYIFLFGHLNFLAVSSESVYEKIKGNFRRELFSGFPLCAVKTTWATVLRLNSLLGRLNLHLSCLFLMYFLISP